MARKILLILPLLALAAGCNRDPEAAQQKLINTGNKYFNSEHYREASIIYRRAIQKDRRYGEAYYRLGLAEVKLGRYRQAMGALRRAIDLQPDNEDAYSQLADIELAVYLSNPRLHEDWLTDLHDLTETAQTRFPDSLAVNRVKGYVALSQKQPREAFEYFSRAAEQAPKDKRIALGLVQSLAQSGKTEDAVRKAEDYIERDPQFARMYDLLYVQKIREKKFDEALAVLKQKCERNPDNIGFRLQLARHYLAARKPEEMNAVIDEVLRNSDRYQNAYLTAGDFFVRFGQLDRAITIYDQGAKKDPRRRSDYDNKKVQVLSMQGKFDEAFRLVEKTLARDPNNSIATALRGALRLKSRDRGEIAAAAADFEAALTRMPENPVLRYNLAEAYRAQGDYDRALVEYQKSIDDRKDYLPPRYRLAGLYMAQGDFPKAVAAAEEVLKLDSKDIRARLIRSMAWVRLGETKQARAELEALIKDAPQSSDAYYYLAKLNLREGRLEDAEALFKWLYNRAPPDMRGLIGLTDIYIAQKKYRQAVDLLQTNLEKNPDSLVLRNALGATLNAVGQRQEAIRVFEDTLKKRPDDVAAHKMLGTIYYSLGDPAAAERYLKRANELAPSDPAPLLYLGMLAERQGALQQAGARYEEVIKLAPDHAVAMNNLAYILAETTADMDRALTLVQKARSLAPNDPNIADTLAYIYIKKNLPRSAIPLLKTVVREHPSIVIWRYHLAMALEQQGQNAEARQQLQTALRQKPTDEEKFKINELLQKVGS